MKSKKPWPGQKKAPYGGQSGVDPSGDAEPWKPVTEEMMNYYDRYRKHDTVTVPALPGLTWPDTDVIRNRRERMGLTDVEVAGGCGLRIAQYDDVERYPDEFTTNVSLGTARKICTVLGLHLQQLLDLKKPSPLLHLQRSEVADRIGFTEDTIAALEQEADFANKLPIQILLDLERVLQIEPGTLIL